MKSNALLIAFAALLTDISHIFQVAQFCAIFPEDCFGSMALSPIRYRLLSQWLMGDGTNGVLFVRAMLWYSVLVPVLFVLLYLWLKRWMSTIRPIIGVWITAGILLFSFHIYGLDISVLIEAILLTAALLLSRGGQRAFLLVCGLVVLATLNRATGLFVALAYLATTMQRRSIILGIIYIGILTALYVTLSQNPAYQIPLENPFAYNLRNVGNGALTWIAFAPLGISAVFSYRTASAPFKRLFWVALLYTGFALFSASWDEFGRYVIVILPMILPAILMEGK